MEHATTVIGIVLIVSNAAIGTEFTNARIPKRSPEIVFMSRGENPFQYCSRVETDDDPGDVPAQSAFTAAPVCARQRAPRRMLAGEQRGELISLNSLQ